MSTINIKKVIEESPGSQDLTSTYTFKLSLDDKEDFLRLCEEKHLSPGKVLRNLLDQFLDGVE
jgi:hypothetical protein